MGAGAARPHCCHAEASAPNGIGGNARGDVEGPAPNGTGGNARGDAEGPAPERGRGNIAHGAAPRPPGRGSKPWVRRMPNPKAPEWGRQKRAQRRGAGSPRRHERGQCRWRERLHGMNGVVSCGTPRRDLEGGTVSRSPGASCTPGSSSGWPRGARRRVRRVPGLSRVAQGPWPHSPGAGERRGCRSRRPRAGGS